MAQGLSETELINGLKKVKEAFTNSRSGNFTYHLDEKLVSSYFSFYFPTNFPKLKFILESLSADLRTEIGKGRLIDIGCGPGTFMAAYLDFFPQNNSSHVAFDHSQLMLDQAKRVIERNFQDKKVDFTSNLPMPGPATTLLFGHSINEMGIKKALEIVGRLSPENIIIIEPGTKDFFKTSLEIRELLREEYKLVYPCPNGELSCPLKDSNDWCHQVLRTKHHESIERISQIVKIDRKTMPLIGQVYTRTTDGPGGVNRIIRFVGEDKHSFNYLVCRADNSHLKVQFNKKAQGKEKLKLLDQKNVGECLSFEVVKELKDGTVRAILKN